VLFDGAAAAILQLSSKEIVAVVPYGFQGRDWVSVVVESLGQQSSPVRVMMVDANRRFSPLMVEAVDRRLPKMATVPRTARPTQSAQGRF